MTRTRKLLALSALALAGTGLVAGCGGDDEDAKEGLKEALTSQPEQVTEAVSSFSVSGSLEGENAGDFSLDLSGPIKFSSDDQPGELDWTVDASANFAGLAAVLGSDSIDIQAGLTLADEQLFVTYNDTAYVAGDDLYQQIGPQLESALSITDATSGLTDEQAQQFVDAFSELSDEGTEDVNGEPAVHYSGTLDAEAFSNLGAEGGVAAADVEGVDEVEMDLYVGEEDNIPRQVDLGFSIDLPEEAQTAVGIDGVDLQISAGTSNLNEPQTIEAPENAKPLDDLLDQIGIDPSQFQIPGLEGLGAGGAGDGGLGTPGGAASDPEVQQCIQEAPDAEAITECLDQ